MRTAALRNPEGAVTDMHLVAFTSLDGQPIKVNADVVGSLFPWENGGTIISSVDGKVIACVTESMDAVSATLEGEAEVGV